MHDHKASHKAGRLPMGPLPAMSISGYTTLALLFGFLASWIFRAFSKQERYPAGPKAHPFVGHTFQVPTVKTWKYFEQLSHKYGALFP
jgi:hypothetical protein